MQIYRKCGRIDTSYWLKAGVVSDTWRSWGFIDATTGDEIQPNPEISAQYEADADMYENNKGFWNYKWKYDTTEPYNYFAFSNCYRGGSYRWFGFNISTSDFIRGTKEYGVKEGYYSDGSRCSWETIKQSWNSGSGGCPYRNVFFIPLKNNGFLFNTCEFPISSASNIAYPFSTSQFRQSPYLFSPSVFITDITSSYTYRNIASIIGFYNNITNEINYLIAKYRDSWDPDAGLCFSFDFKHKHRIDSLEATYIDADGSFTDVRENICTLIKYPYETGFLSNLFIISTEPEIQKTPIYGRTMNDNYGLEGKFFSFNGRNFYGCFRNLAVELPSN